MQESVGTKIMIDLHGLSVKEVKKLLEDHFTKIEDHNIGEIYLITGRGNHVNANGSRGVLKKILPKLLEPYCQNIIQTNREIGAYKIIFKTRKDVYKLKTILSQLLVDEEDQITFAKKLKQQADAKDIEAMRALAAIHLYKAIKGFDDVNQGIDLLEEARNLGSIEATLTLGILFHEGLDVKQRHEKAFKYFCEAAKKNHPRAQYYVAVCYLHGKGVKYNDALAVQWMKKSADQNDPYAQDALGDFYLVGKITSQNFALGIHYKTKAAEQGLADAQIDLARCYATGYGVKQDTKIAYKWYLSAAKANKPYALYQVGSYLIDGRSGLPPAPVEAFGWFLKAAELGDADGQAEVAYRYLFGETPGIQQDIEKGLAFAKKAVDKKNRYGYYVMACAYLEGVGVEKNISKGREFLEYSADAGYDEAAIKLMALLVKFTEADYYALGELTSILLNNAWFMKDKRSKPYLKEQYSYLYEQFVKRVNQLGVEPPVKSPNEEEADHMINYLNNVIKKLNENKVLLLYFGLGLKTMEVKMIQFTGYENDIILEFLALLPETLNHLESNNKNTDCINKIETLLRKQLISPIKNFSSALELLEKELKHQLFSSSGMSKTFVNYAQPSSISISDKADILPRAATNPCSMWYKSALAIGVTVAAVGIATAAFQFK